MHRLIIILALFALLAAPAPGLAMRMLDESGQPVADEQVQEDSNQSAEQGGEAKAATSSALKTPHRAVIKLQPGPKPGTVELPQ